MPYKSIQNYTFSYDGGRRDINQAKRHDIGSVKSQIKEGHTIGGSSGLYPNNPQQQAWLLLATAIAYPQAYDDMKKHTFKN